MLSCGTDKTIFKCKRFSSFLSDVDHFCLKSFNRFYTEGLRGRGQLRVQERTVLLIKLRHCFLSITAKNRIQETTLRNFCYYDNYKTRLSMTKYLALRNGSGLIL